MLWIARKCINADWGQTFELKCVQNICNTKNHVILSNLKEKWSYERLSIIRRWVGRGGFLLPFWQVTCECVCRWGQEHQLLGRRWYQATTFYPLHWWSRPKRWRRCQRWYHWWYSWGAGMVTKRRRLCKTGVIREAGGLNFLSTTCNFFTLGKRCVSVIDVSSCYLPADIEDSPVSGNGGK